MSSSWRRDIEPLGAETNRRREPVFEKVTATQYRAYALGDPNWRDAKAAQPTDLGAGLMLTLRGR